MHANVRISREQHVVLKDECCRENAKVYRSTIEHQSVKALCIQNSEILVYSYRQIPDKTDSVKCIVLVDYILVTRK